MRVEIYGPAFEVELFRDLHGNRIACREGFLDALVLRDGAGAPPQDEGLGAK